MRFHLAALLIYGLLGLILTWPLVARFATHVPGDGIDDPALAWNLWWVKFSLVDRQINPFAGEWMFFPIGINLAFYTLTLLNGLLSVPLQTAFAPVPASNLVLLSSFVLSGYGAYLLALHVLSDGRHVRGSSPNADPSAPILPFFAALLAGLFYAFASAKLFYAALGQFNIASSQWIPFAMLYTLRSLRPRARARDALLAALFLLLQAYAELTYATFLVLFIALYALFLLVEAWLPRTQAGQDRQRQRKGRDDMPAAADTVPRRQQATSALPIVRNLAIIALVFAIGIVPVLANMLPDMMAEGDFFVEGGGFADLFSADVAGYALPTQLHPVLGGLIRAAANDSQVRPDGSHWPVNKGQHIFLGYLATALAAAGLWQGRRSRLVLVFGLSTLVFFLFTLGPTLRFAGHDTGIPGPFRLVQSLPFFKGNRYPSRYSVMLLASAAPLLAVGIRWLLDRLVNMRVSGRRRERAAAFASTMLAALLLFEHLSAPLPLTDLRVPPIYGEVAAAQGTGTVLDLPTGWRNGFNVFGKQDVVIMFQQWWQTAHERPILGGNTSRNPEHKFRYFLEAPLIGPLTVLANADADHPHIRTQMAEALQALRTGDPGLGGDTLLQAAAADADSALRWLDIGHVVVQRNQVPPEYLTFVETYLPLEKVEDDGRRVLFRVRPSSLADGVTIRPAADPLSRGEGWSGPLGADTPLWAQRRQTRLLVPPVQPGPRRIIVRAAAAGPGQALSLVVNGHATPTQALPTSWSELTFDLPAGVLQGTTNDLVLRFERTFPVTQIPVGQLNAPTSDDETGEASAATPFEQRPTQAPPSLLVESAGLEAGNYGHIWLNGIDVSPGQRGYNLALFHATGGDLLAVGAFDTHADPNASDALIAFLDRLDEESVLAVAVKDTAADQLSEAAAEALRGLGLSDLRGRLRWSQAAVVSGATGAVLEEVSGLTGVAVGVGGGWREPQAAAVVDRVSIELNRP